MEPVPSNRQRAGHRVSGLLSRLSRTTSSGNFIPEIDGLRAIALMAVFLFHFEAQTSMFFSKDPVGRLLGRFARDGFFGVPIFFAISAFIVSLPFARAWLQNGPPVSIRQFYLRRLIRLEPPYIINLIILWVLGGAFLTFLPSLAASLIYQHQLIYGYFNPVNTVWWSLEIEFQFYFLAPLLTLLFLVKRAWLRRLLLVATALAVIALRHQENRRVELSLLGQFESFAVGLLLVDFYLTSWQGAKPARPWLDWVGAGAWIAILPALGLPSVFWRQSLVSTLLFLALLGSLGGVRLPRILSNRWVFTFGGMCYSFYMYHQVLIDLFIPVIDKQVKTLGPDWLKYLVEFLFVFPLVTVISAVAFLYLEKPFMQWRSRVTTSTRPVAVTDNLSQTRACGRAGE